MGRSFDNRDDMIDSRDVIERIEELESLLEDCENEGREAAERARIDFINELEDGEEYDEEELVQVMDAAAAEHEPDPDDVEELAVLKALAEEAESSPDWIYGEVLIRDSYFREYAEQLADDIGAINPTRVYNWPLRHIDWDKAAEELKADYFSVDFLGVTYWIRS